MSVSPQQQHDDDMLHRVERPKHISSPSSNAFKMDRKTLNAPGGSGSPQGQLVKSWRGPGGTVLSSNAALREKGTHATVGDLHLFTASMTFMPSPGATSSAVTCCASPSSSDHHPLHRECRRQASEETKPAPSKTAPSLGAVTAASETARQQQLAAQSRGSEVRYT